uniref:Uncharacterized protein n=1 Tax=Chrysemys picta bellii TaxID=8478 RepID=A0A8C3PBE3_CHRPI|nr:histo-blood group ABO system transferase isoform X1 [Chrysemys picta bellii]
MLRPRRAPHFWVSQDRPASVFLRKGAIAVTHPAASGPDSYRGLGGAPGGRIGHRSCWPVRSLLGKPGGLPSPFAPEWDCVDLVRVSRTGRSQSTRLLLASCPPHSPARQQAVCATAALSGEPAAPSFSRMLRYRAGSNKLRNSSSPLGESGYAIDKDQGKTGGVKGYLTKRRLYVVGCITLLCFSFGFVCNHTCFLEDLLQVKLPRMIYTKPQILKPSRSDVLTMTPWFAPIVWEGTYNSEILNEQFRRRNVTVGLTVFAIKKYVVFLKKFLETAEMYFMVGHRVNYYIFTDRPEEVPEVVLKEGRNVVVLQVQNYPRWQEISMRRMEMISNFSQQRFINEVSYLVCVDVDMKFNDQVGVEILSNLFGTLHPGFYAAERQSFTYERRPASQAYVPSDEGDFYYIGAFFGGTVMEVYMLTKKCHEAMMVDKANGIEAIWHDESHLNKYFVYYKPTKILSPEYLWDDNLGRPEILKKRRFLAVPKNHAAIRNK